MNLLPDLPVTLKRLLVLFSCGLLLSLSVAGQSEEPPPQEEDTTTTRTTIEVAPVETIDEVDAGNQFLPLNQMDSIRLQQRKVPDAEVSGLQDQDEFWYANATIEKKKPKKISNDTEFEPEYKRPWVSTVLWVLVVGVFLAVVIYYMAESGLFRRRRKIDTEEAKDLEEMPEDIFAINYQKEIDKAVAGGDYRLAVRLQYLRLLKHMAEKNIIRYQQDKTNMDYLMQLHNTGYYQDFFRITLHYEYSWYGNFTVSQQAYQLIMQDVEKFENRS